MQFSVIRGEGIGIAQRCGIEIDGEAARYCPCRYSVSADGITAGSLLQTTVVCLEGELSVVISR